MADAAIWWIRRDLRLSDNQALQAALAHAQGGLVVPVFVLDDVLLGARTASARRNAFLFDGLRALDAALQARGSRLILRRGEPVAELGRLRAELAALPGVEGVALFAEEDVSPTARARDGRAVGELPLALLPGVATRPLQIVRQATGKGYQVFGPFSKRWMSLPPLRPTELLPAPGALPPLPAVLGSLALDTLPAPTPAQAARFPAGEAEALRRLEFFVDGDGAPLFDYAQTRNQPALDSTARLSPYLRLGMLSARRTAFEAIAAAERAPSPTARDSAGVWLSELLWRDFFIEMLRDHPHVYSGAFRPQYNRIAWLNDEAHFAAWCEGRTGYPIVDAAMRQLAEEGWMHTRLRMVVASFLVKDLLIDWRWGEAFFMQQLLDGDPAANNGNWQWVAGTGADATPYFRIFHPVTQGEKFDPDGAFVRSRLPALAMLPAAHIHAPWTLSSAELAHFGLRLGEEYPLPLVDHAFARTRALAAYRAARINSNI